jgi:hypothetical protein
MCPYHQSNLYQLALLVSEAWHPLGVDMVLGALEMKNDRQEQKTRRFCLAIWDESLIRRLD